jgi:hypothetical protein
MTPKLSRRHVLRGAGVALALPWLESLAPRLAGGQTLPVSVRFIATYFPMGAASFWTPAKVGRGSEWSLSPILEPLAPLKSKLTVLSGVANAASAGTPAYPRDSAGFLTCAAAQGAPLRNGVSVDQAIAMGLYGEALPFRSLQLGLSTQDSGTEGLPPELSRGLSWHSPTNPMGKLIDPQAVFDMLVSAGGRLFQQPDPAAERRRVTRKSVLDFVLGDATAIQPRLSSTDRARLDKFMTSVRSVEQRVQSVVPPPGCTAPPRPLNAVAVGDVPADYDRDAHATVMIDLLVLALACDLTHIASFMFDDARSDFAYGFLKQRTFTATGSTPTATPVGAFRQHAEAGPANDGHATINRWFVTKLVELGQKLASLPDGPDTTLLDNSILWFGSGMNNAQDQSFSNLPLLYLGGGGRKLRTDAHISLPGRRLSDIYLTFIKRVFRLPDASFADSQSDVGELLV